MKKELLLSVALGLLVLNSCSEKNETSVAGIKYVENAAIEAKGMTQIMGMLKKMKPVLKKALEADKTGMGAMIMCASAAPEMGKKYNATLPEGSSIRRTALKYRNPKNKPDATDTAVMQKFVEGRPFDKPLVVEMGDSFRVYKALPVKKACVTCHGDEATLPATMKKFLDKKYPADLAVNFKENDFRGVVVSTTKK